MRLISALSGVMASASAAPAPSGTEGGYGPDSDQAPHAPRRVAKGFLPCVIPLKGEFAVLSATIGEVDADAFYDRARAVQGLRDAQTASVVGPGTATIAGGGAGTGIYQGAAFLTDLSHAGTGRLASLATLTYGFTDDSGVTRSFVISVKPRSRECSFAVIPAAVIGGVAVNLTPTLTGSGTTPVDATVANTGLPADAECRAYLLGKGNYLWDDVVEKYLFKMAVR